MKHHFLVPLQNAVPHGQSKQHLKPLLKISESVDCLVCSDEDLRRNILTDFASINWLTVSFQISIYIKIYDIGLERKWTKRIIVQRKGQVAQSLFMALTHIAFASHVCYIAIPYISSKTT